MHTRRLWAVMLGCCVALGACEATEAGDPSAPGAQAMRAQALGSVEKTTLHPAAPHAQEVPLGGQIEPVRANTDALRVIALDDRAAALGLPAGTRVLDARRVPGGVVALGADRTLRLYTKAQVKTLDTEALGPLSVAASHVAYVRGEAPDLELRLLDLRGGGAARRRRGAEARVVPCALAGWSGGHLHRLVRGAAAPVPRRLGWRRAAAADRHPHALLTRRPDLARGHAHV